MKWSNQRRSTAKLNYNKELLEAAIQRYTSILENYLQGSSFPSKAEDCRPATSLKMKSTTAFFKDLDTKSGTVNYSTDICIISIEQNTFYLIAASSSFRNQHSRKSTTRKSKSESRPPELIWRMVLSKYRQNSWKTQAKEPILLQSCRLEACSCTKNELSHRYPSRILPRS